MELSFASSKDLIKTISLRNIS